jgi:hypothetical protein|uniref:Uncharacterized protein n=1 Tax=viral metagenome TaxID=1070528 RepID=A0A6C0CBF4_9ZZZZ
MATIVMSNDFNASTDFVYTKAKLNERGGKSIGIINNSNKKALYLQTPLMLTWGVNEYIDDNTQKKSYDLALQFPNDVYNNPECDAFLKNMQELEMRIKNDAITNCKEWLNKPKMSPDAVDALWSSMLKYPKDKATEEPDKSRAPSLKVKIPYWEGVFDKDLEIYSESHNLLFPNDDNVSINELIGKASNVATIIKCGGIWVANGKFGVTWKLFQAVVKPKTSLSGRCHIVLSDKDKDKLASAIQADNDDDDEPVVVPSITQVPDSDDEEVPEVVKNVQKKDEVTDEVTDEVKDEVSEEQVKQVAVEDAPKKKRVVKK